MNSIKNKENLPEDIELIEPQLNIILTTDDDDLRPIYISGNFNNWRTQDTNFEMESIFNRIVDI